MKPKLAGLVSAALGGIVASNSMAETPDAAQPLVGTETPIAIPANEIAPLSTAASDCGVCTPNNCCSPGPRYWGSFEYLNWWFKNGNVGIPLVTRGDPNDLVGGALGEPGTTVLFGPGDLDYSSMSGGRLTAGMWLDPANTFGFEVRGLLSEQGDFSRLFTSNGQTTPLLAVPFFNTNPAFPGPQEIAFQASLDAGAGQQLSGSISVESTSRIWGVEANGVWGSGVGVPGNTEAILGFRYFDLQEGFQFQLNTQAEPGTTFMSSGINLGTGGSHAITDNFNTRNQFYGPQIGLRGEQAFGRFIVGWSGKAAIGAMQQTLTINGNTTSTFGAGGAAPAGTAISARGGLFALQSNIGRYSNTEFAVVPEAELKLGYQLNSRLRVFAGYNFTYLSNVVRPGDQLNRRIDATSPPAVGGPFFSPNGNGNPTPQFNTTDFWAHGINLGISVNW